MTALLKEFYEDKIFETMRDDIVRGRYGFGEKLDIARLVWEFGVSRSPVTQAISRLEHEGLVFIKPNVGSFVFDPTETDVREIIQLRSCLELCALDLAIDNLTRAGLDDMEAILRRVDTRHIGKDPESFLDSDRRFHDMFFIAAGNERLRNTMTALRGQLEIFRVGSFSRDAARQSAQYHLDILESLRRKDRPMARQLLSDHITVTGHFAREVLKKAEQHTDPLRK